MKRQGYAKVEQLIERERPDILWLSLPCGATSTIQALNRLTPEAKEKSDKKITLARRRVLVEFPSWRSRSCSVEKCYKSGRRTTGAGASPASAISGIAGIENGGTLRPTRMGVPTALSWRERSSRSPGSSAAPRSGYGSSRGDARRTMSMENVKVDRGRETRLSTPCDCASGLRM